MSVSTRLAKRGVLHYVHDIWRAIWICSRAMHAQLHHALTKPVEPLQDAKHAVLLRHLLQHLRRRVRLRLLIGRRVCTVSTSERGCPLVLAPQNIRTCDLKDEPREMDRRAKRDTIPY